MSRERLLPQTLYLCCCLLTSLEGACKQSYVLLFQFKLWMLSTGCTDSCLRQYFVENQLFPRSLLDKPTKCNEADPVVLGSYFHICHHERLHSFVWFPPKIACSSIQKLKQYPNTQSQWCRPGLYLRTTARTSLAWIPKLSSSFCSGLAGHKVRICRIDISYLSLWNYKLVAAPGCGAF